MSLLVVGSVALDTLKTPFGKVKKALGGSATYFSVVASFFTPVRFVAVVGRDFPEKHINFLKSRNIDLKGLEKAEGKTFQWTGEYNSENLNEAKTIDTRLNVFANFRPKIPRSYVDTKYVFLANIDPDLQINVLDQIKKPLFVACDTMNYWIENKKKSLMKLLPKVDALIVNASETRQWTGEYSLLKGARKILSMGIRSLIVKCGEYGASMFTKKSIFSIPAFHLESPRDPTGAGDSFAGGFMGYLAKTGNTTESNLRRAVVQGTIFASFAVEKFSLDRFKSLTWKEVNKRYSEFKKLTSF